MILAINTSTMQFGMSVLSMDGEVMAEHLMAAGKGNFGFLMPSLDFMFSSLKLDLNKVKAIAVAMGPGSYTGLRVGLSSAKGLSHALEIPVIGISSLEALASQIPYSTRRIAPVLDSRKGELFTAEFKWSENGDLVRTKDDVSLRLENIPDFFLKDTVFIGNNFTIQSRQIREYSSVHSIFAPPYVWCLKASTIGYHGLKKFYAGEYDNPELLNPIYLRPPDIGVNPYPLI